jgi:hypothetical protein
VTDQLQLQHDPRTKQQIKDTLYGLLYDPVQKQYKFRLDTLIVRNTISGGYAHKSFMYRNVLYSCDINTPPRRMNRLMPALQQEVNDYLKDLKQLNEKEVPYVLGYINQVLNSTNNLSDYLRLLPDAVHEPLKELIASCPCQLHKLHEDTVTMLQEKNQSAITLMKTRMVTNLII